MKNWAMLAVNFDEVEDIGFPCMGQPKLNGIRAAWDGQHLSSRQGKIWKPETLPHIYDKLTIFSKLNPGILLDGELYAHGMPLQEIVERTAINRNTSHGSCDDISFHAFDIISSDDTESRQITLSQIYSPWVPVCQVMNRDDVDHWLRAYKDAGFEGLMLRQYHCPYSQGRTECLIKVKPWKYGSVTVTGFIEGEGRCKDMLGAFKVKAGVATEKVSMRLVSFKVGGGEALRDDMRIFIWRNQGLYEGKPIKIRYRDISNSGIPMHPQCVSL